jgi:hypothetical protein
MDDLIHALMYIEDRATVAMDGCGLTPWTREYLLEILSDIAARAREAIYEHDAAIYEITEEE